MAALAMALLAACAAPVRVPDAPPVTVVEPEPTPPPASPTGHARPVIIRLPSADSPPDAPGAPAAESSAIPGPSPSPVAIPDATPTPVQPPAPDATPAPHAPPVIIRLPPPEEPAPTPPPEGPETWVDTTHDMVSRLLDWSAKGVDRAFGDSREVDIKPARTFIAWRNELQFHRAERVSVATSARTEVVLPALTSRLRGLRLLFVGSTPQADLTYRPLDSAPDAIGRQSAGLRLAFGQSLRWSADLQGGLLGQWPLGYYARFRVRRSRPFPFQSVGRAAVSALWQTNTGWGTRQDVSLERLLGERVLARLSGTGTVTEARHPWAWDGEASVLSTFDQSMSLQVAGGPSGTVKTGMPGATWRLRTCLRREVLRRWIFIEVEPHVEWRPESGGRVAEGALVVRLEIQFGTGTVPDAAEPRRAP